MSILTDQEREWGGREIRLPVSPDDPSGPFVIAVAHIKFGTTDSGVACIVRLPKQVGWLIEDEDAYYETMKDGETLQAIRLAEAGDWKKFRVPHWQQGEEVPECCGKPMFFVGQIDDDDLWAEPPPDAELWWHDSASFYVFTCSKCLSVEAVGQQG